MPAFVIVGAQWGDEGKGKATDLLAEHIQYVVKFNGGNNAGHTVVIGSEKYALHLLPSGILTPGVIPVIGNGVVIDLHVLFEELDALNARGIDTSRLRISANAHVITPYHVSLDKTAERFLGKRAIGTTGRGIGPTYADKINRIGIRVQDLFDESILRQKVEAALVQKNQLLSKVYNRAAIRTEEIVSELLSYTDRLRPFVADTALELHEAIESGKNVLFEGGQATMLDVDEFARILKNKIPKMKDALLLGPVSASISLIKGKYRSRLLLKYPQEAFPQKFLKDWLKTIKIKKNISLTVDVDPINFK